MRPRASASFRTALIWAVALGCAGEASARRAGPPVPAPTASARSVAPAPTAAAAALAPGPADSVRQMLVASEIVTPDRIRLGRAAMEQRLANPRGVVENLESLDFDSPAAFPEADRAAFLLAQAYLKLGSRDRFLELADRVGRWERPTPYTQWLAFQRLMIEIEDGGAAATPVATGPDSLGASPPSDVARVGQAAADGLAAGLLLDQGQDAAAMRLLNASAAGGPSAAFITYLKVVVLQRSGRDDGAELAALAGADTVTALGRDLAGVALIGLATRAIARGDDPRELLERVAVGSRYFPRARHMLGLNALERGDGERGEAILGALLVEAPTYGDHREVGLALAGHALERGRWDVAQTTYGQIEQNWDRDHDELTRELADGSFDWLWSVWSADPPASEALVLDSEPARILADQLAMSAADLDATPPPATPALSAPPPPAWWTVPVAPPAPDAWRAVAASQHRLDAAADTLERARRAAAGERAALGQRRGYLGFGLVQLRSEMVRLSAQSSLLDSLRGSLDSLDARLRGVRDAETRRIAVRTAALLDASARNVRWIHAMRRLYIDGPDRARAIVSPIGYAGPDSVLVSEEALATSVATMADSTAAQSPGLIARSYRDAWRPGLIDRASIEAGDARRALAWAHLLQGTIDSTIATSGSSPALQRLDAEVALLTRESDSLLASHERLKTHVAREAIEHALVAMEPQREAIDYGLAAAEYGLSVHLDRPDSTGLAAAIASGAATGAARDSAHAARAADEELDDPKAAEWRTRAIGTLQGFLRRHPQSPARAEMRFRLADLLIIESHHRFRDQMAAFVRGQEAGDAAGMAVPVQDHTEALALYRQILAGDPEFTHRDAVLFNAGMILADDADPEAATFFANLVTSFPESPYVQESYLRMGDIQFNDKRFAEGVGFYEHAAKGPDAGLEVIALYKLGWAHFNEDRFLDAAGAFRSVLDLYGSEHRGEIQADIEGESESYLVHSLAGAGGAPAFAGYFDRIGSRPYERRILMALGQHFRRYGQFPDATAVDELCIQRYPLESDALLSAQRMIETYQRSDHAALEQQARLTYAARFAPSSPWAGAQTSDSLRSAGSEFARASYKSVALEHHRKARENGSRADWQQALELYDTILSTWPDDPDAPSLELNAGEASAQLGDYPGALHHYRAIAASARDSVAAQALWQVVAVSDAWYESTRAPSTEGHSALGRDSLAHAVIAAGDTLLARFPEHPKAADLVWRQSQLAYAHGWYERATQDLARLASRYPDDRRAPVAAGQRGDALFQLGDFEAAGNAFEDALASAERAGRDSLATNARLAIPICHYRAAEAAVAADSTHYAKHAAMFEAVATRWPGYEHADLAEYRAGLAYVKAGQARDAVRTMQSLIRQFPKSEYVRDAYLQLGRTWEAIGDREPAATAYADFAERYPDDESARGAWLRAAELLTAVGAVQRADDLRLAYIQKYPDDLETAMDILEALARRDLETVSPQHPISALLDVPPPAARGARGTGGKTGRSGRVAGKPAVGGSTPVPAPSHLAEYLRRAVVHPELASHALLAQVRFLEAEELQLAFTAARLTQPLPKSLPGKQKLLDSLLVRYRRSVDLGVAEWAHASTYRIGQSLVCFGDALQRAERPADLHGDDLLAYEDVLMQQAQVFYERAEAVWTDLLRQKGQQATDDTWVAQAQGALWLRLSDRFYYRPELEYPLIGATPVSSSKPDDKKQGAARGHRSSRGKHAQAQPVADREGGKP